MIQIDCPHCEDHVSFSNSVGGFEVKCPSCRIPIDVPEQGSTLDPYSDGAVRREVLAQQLEALGLQPKQPQPMGWPQAVAILLGIPLVVAALAWLLAGTAVGSFVGVVLAVIGLSLAVAFLKSLFRGEFSLAVLLIVLYCGGVVGVWFGVEHVAKDGSAPFADNTATVHIDNYSGEKLVVEIDGETIGTYSSRRTRQRELSKGRHEIVVRDTDGKERKRYSVTVETGKTYVLNLLAGQKYYRGMQYYGNYFGGAPRDVPEVITKSWFEADADFVFETPPESIEVSTMPGMEGIQTASRSYLRRGSPSPQR